MVIAVGKAWLGWLKQSGHESPSISLPVCQPRQNWVEMCPDVVKLVGLRQHFRVRRALRFHKILGRPALSPASRSSLPRPHSRKLGTCALNDDDDPTAGEQLTHSDTPGTPRQDEVYVLLLLYARDIAHADDFVVLKTGRVVRINLR